MTNLHHILIQAMNCYHQYHNLNRDVPVIFPKNYSFSVYQSQKSMLPNDILVEDIGWYFQQVVNTVFFQSQSIFISIFENLISFPKNKKIKKTNKQITFA